MSSSYNVLVLGCGNIGAQYDLDTPGVKTHVKAWSLMPNVNLSIFDLNKDLEEKISRKYKCRILESINIESISSFDCISICTPTETHKDLLMTAFKAGVKVIICEKPVTYDLDHVGDILEAYHSGSSKVLVNYIRRFQPAYLKLQNYISTITQNGEILKAVNIKYNRGFINNCSHALDLVEFLFKQDLVIENLCKFNRAYDHFSYDPTLSLSGKWGDATILILGLNDVLFSIFEIELYFKTQKILIINAGDHIEFYTSPQRSATQIPLIKTEELSGCITDYMKFVIEKALGILGGESKEDNFISSVTLNAKMLNYLND